MPDGSDQSPPDFYSRSQRRRRSVKQLLFVVAGSHTGAFLGSSLPTNFGLPGNLSGVALVVALFALPFVVDEHWEWFDDRWVALTGRDEDGTVDRLMGDGDAGESESADESESESGDAGEGDSADSGGETVEDDTGSREQ